MRLYDSLRQEHVEVVPPDGVVRMYVCGITPYDTTHMGHARTYVVFDALSRFLEDRGCTVRYVQNVTDIDDDILRKARQLGVPWDELGRRETERFLRDMDALNVRRPTFYVKATDHIPMMQEIIQVLIDKGLAYVRKGNVYFDISRDPDFGKLAHMGYAEMLRTANERGNNPDDPHKDDPLDFVLWQAAQPGEPTWKSPWGPGRPGWHIECSAMAMQYLGAQLQIHGGGADLQFPHHECEIAQSENYTGVEPFAQAWVHVGMVYLGGEKMSKSLGNLVLVSDVLQRYSANAIRLALLGYHYRQPFGYSDEDVARAEAVVDRWQTALADDRSHNPSGSITAELLEHEAVAALEDDFNTPEAIRVMNRLVDAALAGAVDSPLVAARAIRRIGGSLGLSLPAGE
ncbi:MAG: cysteine--tRNA ligase [Herpetosiphonaceae bacterium]|nr:MAG: cysteine--tRNA ligase [Herpetosiphonaceae bacterium]